MLKAGEAEIALSGRYVEAQGAASGLAQLEGRISPMPLANLKALWPQALAPRARQFAMQHIRSGQLHGGSFRLATDISSHPGVRPSRDGRQISLTLEANDLAMDLDQRLPPIEIPKAFLRVEGTSLEVSVPDAQISVSTVRKVALKGGRLTVVDIDTERPTAELVLRAQAPLPVAVELLEREPIAAFGGTAMPLANLDGRTEAQLRMTVPLSETLSLAEARYEGRVRVLDGRLKDAFGSHSITGASITLDTTEKSTELKGELLLGGVLAKVNGQWQPGATEGRQTPLRITARLDTADRLALGLDLEHLVHGDVPLEIVLQRDPGEEAKFRFSADLTASEIEIDDLHWKKPTGRDAKVTFDIARPASGKGFELPNFRLAGDNIAIEGSVSIGPDNKPREFRFPEFSLNVVSNLSVHGRFRADRVWEVAAAGRSYDASGLMRSLIAFADDGRTVAPRNRPGLDLTAEVDSAIGANDTLLRQVKLRLQKRSERLTALEFTAGLENGQTLSAFLRPEPGKPRLLVAETSDAGQALKVVGLYGNLVGGSGSLRMNLEPRGAAERSGQLSIRRFSVLGDPIVSEVVQNADEGRPAIENGRRTRRYTREQFEFDRLDTQFAMGNGQIAIENAVITGPLIGASLRGKLDFRSRTMQLGGTYVPLSELNRAVGQIPILGLLLAGPKGEGVLAVTFAVEGSMTDPQVIVNPLSFMAPGILREIFQMAPDNPRITPRVEPTAKAVPGAGPKVRSSPPLAPAPGVASEGQSRGGASTPEVVDGWSATETKPGRTR